MSGQGKPCEYCWHPPQQVEGHNGLHNEGCPMIDATNMAEWKRGQAYGFNDNHIEAWQYRFYKPASILGWRAGKEEIDALVEEAAESRC